MDTKAELVEIIKNSGLDRELKTVVIALVEEGPVTKSLVDDVINLLEAKAMEQDKVEEIENQKADIYEELTDKLREIADQVTEAETKNLEQLAGNLQSVAEEAKAHLVNQGGVAS